MKRCREEIPTVGSEGEDGEGTLDQSEDEEGDKGGSCLVDESEDEQNEGSCFHESEDEGDKGSRLLDESKDERSEGSFHSDDEGSPNKIYFKAISDHDLQFSEGDRLEYSDSEREEILRYHNEMRETEGFGVTFEPNAILIGAVTPFDLTKLSSSRVKKLEECAIYAMNRHNQNKNNSLKFVKLEKVTAKACYGFLYYITFIAANSSGEEKAYETRVYYKINRPYAVEVFRMKKSTQV